MKTKQLLNFRFKMMKIKSTTNSTTTCNIKKVMQPNRCLLVFALYFLLVCLSTDAQAQLVPLVSYQDSLFVQTPQESEDSIEKTDKKIAKPKMTAEMKKKKEYKEDKSIKVKDPEGFFTNQGNRLFSGPQSGEKLPPFQVKGLDGKKFDITAQADGKPTVLFLQDSNGVGIKGLVNATSLLLKIDSIHKRRMSTKTKISNQGLHIGVVILADDIEELPEWSQRMFKDEIPDVIKKGISQDGREGPGSYGLNRNVLQTVIVVKDGKVLHNFAFVQPMLYADAHLLGAVAQAIEIESAQLEKWLNEVSHDTSKKEMKSNEALYAQIQKAVKEERLSKADALEKLKILGLQVEEGDELLKKTEDNPQSTEKKRPSINLEKMDAKERMERESKSDQARNPSRAEIVKRFDKDGDGVLNLEEGKAARRALANRVAQNRQRYTRVSVKEPAEFKKTQKKELFSGPQPGEKLPPLMVTGINGETKDKTYDVIAKADGQLLVLFLQDESGLGLRGLLGVSRLLTQITEKSKQTMHINAVFLGDTPDTLENQASKLIPHIPSGILLGISLDGREGPGNYGLNRSIAQTVIIAKDGKVLYNFAFTQPMLRPDPHVLGAIGEAIGVQPATLEKWLNVKNPVIEIKKPAEGEEAGKMLLNGTFVLDGNVVHLDGTVVQFDGLLTLLRDLPEEQKSMLIIQAERDVPHEQIVKVMDITKEAGIDKIGFGISEAENKRMDPNKAQEQRGKESK